MTRPWLSFPEGNLAFDNITSLLIFSCSRFSYSLKIKMFLIFLDSVLRTAQNVYKCDKIFHCSCTYIFFTQKINIFPFLSGLAGYKRSDLSFLFSIKNESNTQLKFPIKKGKNDKAIYCDLSSGAAFGNGGDLFISSNANTNRNSYSNLGYTYQTPPKFEPGVPETRALLAGSYYFSPSEIEVFRIWTKVKLILWPLYTCNYCCDFRCSDVWEPLFAHSLFIHSFTSVKKRKSLIKSQQKSQVLTGFHMTFTANVKPLKTFWIGKFWAVAIPNLTLLKDAGTLLLRYIGM